MRKISLNGKWELSCSFGKLEAQVPGCLHKDLLRADIIKDPLLRDNAESCRELEFERPVYSKKFVFNESAEKIFLEFSMLDVYCDVFLNGQHLGFCENMFIPHRFDVSKIVKKGENIIEVKFYPPAEYVKDKPKRSGAFTTERLYTRRIQCTYSWDWVDRFVTMGISGGVQLMIPSETEIDSFFVKTTDADISCAQVCISTDFECFGEKDFLKTEVKDPDGNIIYKNKRLIAEKNITQNIDIENPKLWFPSGYGEQPLYTAILSTGNDKFEVKFGIRRVKAVQLRDKEDSVNYRKCKELQQTTHLRAIDKNEEFYGFEICVNGKKIQCRGADWVPSEPFVSEESDEKITRILELAKEAGMNIIRVWGGGIFEKGHFYSECDRLGIMVCQDFLMACGNYPQEDKEFCENLRLETEYISKKLRNHASFIMWIGDNENAAGCDDDMNLYPGRYVVRSVIEPVIRKNDVGRIFLPSSPYGGKQYQSATRGTTHNTAFLYVIFDWILKSDMKDFKKRAEEYITRFSIEEPTLGAPQKSTVMKFMTNEDFEDPGEYMWRFHTKNNPGMKDYEIYDCMRTAAKKLYGDFTDADDKLIKMQYLQYEWVSRTMELCRINSGFSSGMMYWMLNDCWPAFGWALIDYYAVPKAGWYGFKHASKPLKAAFDKDGNVYVCSDKKVIVSGKISLYKITDKCEKIAETDFELGEGESKLLLKQNNIDEHAVYLCDVEAEGETDRTVWCKERLRDTRVKSGKVKIVSGNNEQITIKAEGFVYAVMLDGENRVFEDNCFAMLDGETKTLKIRGNGNADITVMKM